MSLCQHGVQTDAGYECSACVTTSPRPIGESLALRGLDAVAEALDEVLNLIGPMTTVSPAERRAEDLNLPVVRLTNFELARILAGNPMICTDHNGGEVLVRLATADEFLSVHRAACAKYGIEPTATRAKAIELTTPIGGTW